MIALRPPNPALRRVSMSTPSAQEVSRLPSFYTVPGMVRCDADCYADREADAELHRALTSRQFYNILMPRRMGKSSLGVRTTVRLTEKGAGVLVLDLTPSRMNLTADAPACPNLSGQCSTSPQRCWTGGWFLPRPPRLTSNPSRMKCQKLISVICLTSFASLSRTS
jgi:hypothetical protein